MKRARLCLSLVLFFCMIFVNSVHTVMGPKRWAQCAFKPNTYHCSKVEMKNARKWLVGASVTVISAIALAVGIKVGAKEIKEARQDSINRQRDEEKRGVGGEHQGDDSRKSIQSDGDDSRKSVQSDKDLLLRLLRFDESVEEEDQEIISLFDRLKQVDLNALRYDIEEYRGDLALSLIGYLCIKGKEKFSSDNKFIFYLNKLLQSGVQPTKGDAHAYQHHIKTERFQHISNPTLNKLEQLIEKFLKR